MLRRTFLHRSLSAAGLALLPGCAGYQLGNIKPKRYENIETIAVQTAHNRTLEPRVEVLLANVIIKQFQQDGTYKVARENEADAILETLLEEIVRRPARNQNGNVLLAREYTLTLRVRYKFMRRSSGELLESRLVQGQTSFFATGSSLIQADVNQDERQAFPLAAEDLAVRMVALLSEGW
jgi:uncharacterized protein (DUF2336 family)